MVQKVYVKFGSINVVAGDTSQGLPVRPNIGIAGYIVQDDPTVLVAIRGVSTDEAATAGTAGTNPDWRLSFEDNSHEIKNKAIQALIWKFGYEAPHITITEHEMVFLNTDFS